jgi:archaellin
MSVGVIVLIAMGPVAAVVGAVGVVVLASRHLLDRAQTPRRTRETTHARVSPPVCPNSAAGAVQPPTPLRRPRCPRLLEGWP